MKDLIIVPEKSGGIIFVASSNPNLDTKKLLKVAEKISLSAYDRWLTVVNGTMPMPSR